MSMRDLISSKEANKGWSYRVNTIFKPQGPIESWFTFVLWIISISIDPLLLYLPVINDDNKSLEFNIKLVGLLGVLLLLLQSCGFAVKQAYFLTSCSFVFGGIWYLFAIRKKTECWKKACRNHNGCHLDAIFGFIVSSGNTKFLNDNCPKILETNYAESYELGMFKDAFEFGIVESKNFPRKLLHCFRWGIQNLSGIGQSLSASSHAAENIFVIFIIVYGVVMFAYFLGNLQMYIKSATEASDKKIWKEQQIERKQMEMEIEKWVPFGNLSEELQNCIKKNHQYQRIEIVDVKSLLENVSEDIQNNIKRELCSELLKKVRRFEKWREASLFHLCDCLRPVVYKKVTRPRNPCEDRIFKRWGDNDNGINPYRMTFVIQGIRWTSKIAVSTREGNRKLARDIWGECFFWYNRNETDLFKDGIFWGEEFFNCIQNDRDRSYAVWNTSDRTIRAVSKVEAFELWDFEILDSDLKNLYNEKAKVIESWFRKRRKVRALTKLEQTVHKLIRGHWLSAPENVV